MRTKVFIVYAGCKIVVENVLTFSIRYGILVIFFRYGIFEHNYFIRRLVGRGDYGGV